jgi:hypothetical protein
MKIRHRPLHVVPSNGQPTPAPNRFHYYVAAAWSLAGQSGHISESITSQVPVVDISQIRKIEAKLASMIQAKDTQTGAALVGGVASVVLLNIQLLRAYYEDAAFNPQGTSQASDPPPAPPTEQAG